MKNKIIWICMFLLIVIPLASSNFYLSSQGTNLKDSSGDVVTNGNLTVEIWTDMTSGSMLYQENFTNNITDGAWNVMLNISTDDLERGRTYYIDYQFNGEDADFGGNERLIFTSFVGENITNISWIKPQNNILNILGNLTVDTNTLFVDSTDGKVGIGTTSPSSLLEIYDTDAAPVLTITGAHASIYDPQIKFRTDTIPSVKFSLGVDSADDKFKIFSGDGIGDTSEFVIDTSGNVGIGTASPIGDFVVEDTNLLTYFNSTENQMTMHLTNPTRDWLIISDNSPDLFRIVDGTTAGTPDRFVINSDGNVGIGTTNPNQGRLQITQASDSYNSGISIENAATTASGRIYMNGPDFILQKGTNTNQLVLDSSGNVGIGTTTPSSKVEINGSYAVGEYGSQLHLHTTNNNDNGMYLGSWDNNGVISAGSKYYAGGNYTAKSTEARGIDFGQGLSAIKIWYNTGLTAGNTFTPTSRLVIDSSGRIGIGTTTPQNKLNVIGDINFTGLIYGNGSQLTGLTLTESDPLWSAWDNLTGIPHATPSDGDTTHFSLADEIYDWVISLTYATTTYVDNLVASVGNWTADKGDYSTTAEANALYSTIDEPRWSGNSTLVPYLASANVYTANQDLTGYNVTASYFISGLNAGITGNYSIGDCWMAYSGGIMYSTNCTFY